MVLVENNRVPFSIYAVPAKIADSCRCLFRKVAEIGKRVFNSIDRNDVRMAYFFLVTIIGQVIILSPISNPHMTAFGIGVIQGMLLELGISLTR